jgi:hypothetical protein
LAPEHITGGSATAFVSQGERREGLVHRVHPVHLDQRVGGGGGLSHCRPSLQRIDQQDKSTVSRMWVS